MTGCVDPIFVIRDHQDSGRGRDLHQITAKWVDEPRFEPRSSLCLQPATGWGVLHEDEAGYDAHLGPPQRRGDWLRILRKECMLQLSESRGTQSNQRGLAG